MHIDGIDIFHVSLPLISPFNTSYGDTSVIESVLVRMRSDALEGWGEAMSWTTPGYSSEYAGSTFDVIERFLAPLVLGQSFDTSRSLLQAIAHVKGNYFAKGAIDEAWWDLHAKMQDKPLWQVLGGQGDTVDVGADFGVMPTIEELLEKITEALEHGFKRIKLKFRPGWDVPMVARVRETFPDAVFHVDCNSAYTLADVDVFKALDEYQLAMIEQPLSHDDLIDHARLQSMLQTPICLDESITSPDRARKAIEIGACRWINVKPPRVGGMTPAMDILELCGQANIPCWIGSMLESNIGSAHCLALATLPNVEYPSDVFPSDRFYQADLAEPPLTLTGPSQATALVGPGIGVEPNMQQIERVTLRKQSLTK